MSKSAWLFLCLTLITALFAMASQPEDGQTAAYIACAVFGSLLLLTLITGRRIKFDPMLR